MVEKTVQEIKAGSPYLIQPMTIIINYGRFNFLN